MEKERRNNNKSSNVAELQPFSGKIKGAKNQATKVYMNSDTHAGAEPRLAQAHPQSVCVCF